MDGHGCGGLQAKMTFIARLIHLNGPPGVGKTSIARRYLADHPLALMVDVDNLRAALGRWETEEASKLIARDLALALIGAHLTSGRDVVVPQFLGRPAFIEALDVTAAQHGAPFVEILLHAEPSTAVGRFRHRRQDLSSQGTPHPEAEVGDAEVDEIVAAAINQLAALARTRPNVITISADSDLEQTYAAALTAIARRHPLT